MLLCVEFDLLSEGKERMNFVGFMVGHGDL